jgi:serine/threonine-protein kinase
MSGSPVSGGARPPVPRPVSGARGAASVPSGPPAQPQSSSHRPPYQAQPKPSSQPHPLGKPETSAGRQVLIVLAVVLALLVLLCAGVISFLYHQSNQSNGASRGRDAVVHTGVHGIEPPRASYRLTKQAGANPGWIRANEGRLTL